MIMLMLKLVFATDASHRERKTQLRPLHMDDAKDAESALLMFTMVLILLHENGYSDSAA